MNLIQNMLERVGWLFYIVNPTKSMFKTVEEVPQYLNQVGQRISWKLSIVVFQAVPYFAGFMVLERLILYTKGRNQPRTNDSLTSVSTGVMMQVLKTLTHGIEYIAYFYIYDKFGRGNLELPWDSMWTWFFAAVGIDFGFYWAHRFGHEISFLWAMHQVHHSSEDYNLTTATRKSVFQNFGWVLFWTPLAFFIPPPIFLVHKDFNLLYQYWIHTELIDNVGPLEYILNTPSHHRVHHGANKYCLDKNYAGVLIIWDRMFGTFQWEREAEKPVYGLVTPVQSFNPMYQQFFYFRDIYNNAKKMDTWSDRLSAVFKGPGWCKGTARLGDPSTFPEVGPREKFDVKIPPWQTYYCIVHSLLMVAAYSILAKNTINLTPAELYVACFYILFSLTSVGLIFDAHPASPACEVARCLAFVFVTQNSSIGLSLTILSSLRGLFFLSALVWAMVVIKRDTAISKKKLM